jgi:hypothetical protein
VSSLACARLCVRGSIVVASSNLRIVQTQHHGLRRAAETACGSCCFECGAASDHRRTLHDPQRRADVSEGAFTTFTTWFTTY